MVAEGIPSIFLRAFHESRTNRIQVHIGQQIDQRSTVLDDQGLETIPPEIALSAMLFVVETGESLLDILDEFGKRRSPGTEGLNGVA